MGKLNFLLVVPRYHTYGNSKKYVMPMGMLCVSSYVKQSGIAKVFTLNLNHVEGNEFDILSSFVKTNDIQAFGIGGLSGEFQDVSRIVRYMRQIKENLVIIVGGGIMTADPQVTMKALPEIDYGIIGEGEITIVELLDALANNKDITHIAGLIYREKDGLVQTKRRPEIEDLDSLPLPDYDGFNYKQYLIDNPDLSDEGKKFSQVSVIGGRSCKYNCTFCFHPSGTTYRQRSLDSIFTEIDYLVSNYDISYIALREELFSTDNKRVADFCARIEKYDFDWSIQLRIDSINAELINLLRGTRCRYVFVGVESADDKVLKSMRKGITLSQIEMALDMLKEAGLNSRSGVIFGDSAETLETAMFTLDWYERSKDKYRLFVDMIIAFPGSTLYKRACSNGVISNPVTFLQDGCPIINVSEMSDSEFLKLVKRIESINHRKYNIKFYC